MFLAIAIAKPFGHEWPSIVSIIPLHERVEFLLALPPFLAISVWTTRIEFL
jgi:hypothetical protein